MSRERGPFRPKVLHGRGVFEDTVFTLSDPNAFALKAVNRFGRTVDWEVVHNWDEYDDACRRLWAELDRKDPIAPLSIVRDA